MKTINTVLLVEWMNNTGLTYSEISRRADISRNTIYNILSGKTYPSAVVMQNLANVLGMTESDFAGTFFPNTLFKK